MSNKLTKVFLKKGMISNPVFENHIKALLEGLPDYILKIPSSSTGKYHPKDEISKDGMIKHIKRCLILCKEYSKMFQLPNNEQDILTAGCILHDMYKQGEGRIPCGATVSEHPIYIYGHIQNYIQDLDKKDRTTIGTMLDILSVICLHHEGQWTITESRRLRQTDIYNEKLVDVMHLIDYTASRRSIYNMMQDDFMEV